MGTRESWLIFGGGGFIGHNLALELVKRGVDTSLFDLTYPRAIKRTGVEIIVGCILDYNSVLEATKGKNVVVNAVAIIEHPDPGFIRKVNLEGTKNLIRACLENGVGKFIQISSAGAHFQGYDLRNISEEYPVCDDESDSYFFSKAQSDELTCKGNSDKLLTACIRPTSVFGPGDSNVTKELYEAAQAGKQRFMFGSHGTICDFTYVDNVVHSIILVSEKMGVVSGVAGNSFIITNDEPMFFWDFPKYFLESSGFRDCQIVCLPLFLITILAYLCDIFTQIFVPLGAKRPTLSTMRVKLASSDRYFNITKSKTLLSYKPLISMKDGVEKTASYWRLKRLNDANR